MTSERPDILPSRRVPGRYRAWRCLSWLIVAGAISVWQMPSLTAISWPPKEVVSDFYQDWASARNVLGGLPAYTDHRVTIPLYVGEVDPVCYCNRINAHPPTSILLFLPVARLDYRPALLIWNVASLIMLAGSIWMIRRELGFSFSAWSIVPALSLLLLCRPLVQQLIHGQLNLAMLLLVTGAWAADRRGRPGWAGALVGTAAAVKVFPGFLFLYFAVRRQWRAVIAGGLTVFLLSGTTVAVLGPASFRTYVQDVLPQVERFRSSWFNASLVGFWTRLFDPATLEEHVDPLWRSAATARAGIILSWVAIVAAVSWVVRQAASRLQLDHAFGAAVAGMLLLSPVTWDHGFLLLLIPVAVLWRDPPRSEAAKLLLVGTLGALWLWQKPLCHAVISGGVTRGIASPLHAVTVLSYPCYGLVVLFSLSVAGARRVRPVRASSEPGRARLKPDAARST